MERKLRIIKIHQTKPSNPFQKVHYINDEYKDGFYFSIIQNTDDDFYKNRWEAYTSAYSTLLPTKEEIRLNLEGKGILNTWDVVTNNTLDGLIKELQDEHQVKIIIEYSKL